jgi:hypothetical protein
VYDIHAIVPNKNVLLNMETDKHTQKCISSYLAKRTSSLVVRSEFHALCLIVYPLVGGCCHWLTR